MASLRTISVRSLRTLLAYLQITGKARLIFRDIHGEALLAAELEFRRAAARYHQGSRR